MAMQITSTAFADGQPIPRKYTGDGADVSPPLSWSDVPPGTAELCLVCDDPDAPTPEPWVHWVLYGIPPQRSSLPEGVPPDLQLPQLGGALQGRNSWTTGRTIGYRGPAPPRGHGAHHYHFRLYALDAPLRLQPGADKATLLRAAQPHILAQARLTGTYERH